MTVIPLVPALIPVYQPAPPPAGSGTSPPPAQGNPPGTGSSAPPPAPPGPTTPIIASLSVPQGQPGDPVMINGSNFGSGGGEIHFVIGPGKDLVAAAGAVWTDTQIFTSVPDVVGVGAFNGQVYVKRTTDQKLSNLAAFRFEPLLEMREIRATMDRALTAPVWNNAISSPPHEIYHGRASQEFLFGTKNNDQLLLNTRLKNGWVTDSAMVTCSTTACSGGAYVWEIKQGTDWPYLNVRWWLNPDPPFGFASVKYQFAVRIVGPKAMADGVVVPARAEGARLRFMTAPSEICGAKGDACSIRACCLRDSGSGALPAWHGASPPSCVSATTCCASPLKVADDSKELCVSRFVCAWPCLHISKSRPEARGRYGERLGLARA